MTMFSADSPRRIFAYREPVDMRKQFAGLIALAKNAMGEDPLSGSMYVFINRRRNLLKLVYWDRTGFCLFAKKLEKGRFVLQGTETKRELTEQTFRLLLDGIVLGGR